jgi:uncharacterized protein YneF (UPF0154 family)
VSQEEKLALAEKFVREAAADLGMKVSEARLHEAAKKAAKALPPF